MGQLAHKGAKLRSGVVGSTATASASATASAPASPIPEKPAAAGLVAKTANPQTCLDTAAWLTQQVHDFPLLGVITTAVEDGFTGLLWNPPTHEELRNAFDAVDSSKRGLLDRTGIAEALRHLHKSERQVQKLVDFMPLEELDFVGFQELLVPPPHPWVYHLGGVLPIPNHEKLFDTPVLGNFLHATNDSLAQPVDNTLRSWRSTTYPPSDHRMTSIFLELGGASSKAQSVTRLSRAEVPQAMRKFFKTEAEIKTTLEALSGDISLYEFKRMIRGPKYTPSVVNYVPMVGPALAANLLSVFNDDVPEEDQCEAFEFMDKRKSGKLDKTEIADLFRELGKSELEVQKLIDAIAAEELDFYGFKDLMMNGVSHELTTTVSGYPVPNPAKLHDVPVVGTWTMFTQDILVDTYQWTAGPAYRYVRSFEEEELLEHFKAFSKQIPNALTRREVARCLRSLGFSEAEIKARCNAFDAESLNFDEFRNLAVLGQPTREHPLTVLGHKLKGSFDT